MDTLIERLSVAFNRATPMAACDSKTKLGPALISYFAIERERMESARLPMPFIVVPLEGHKEIWRGDHCQRFAPGEVFALPADVPLDIVNEPGRKTGRYASIIFGCPPSLAGPVRAPALPHVDPARPALVRRNDDVAEALVRAALVLADKEETRELAEIRMREVLLLLRNDPAVRAMFERRRGSQVANIVRTDLARKWSVAEVAHELHMAESTLRRQLASEGASFRAILKSERMALAETLLTTRGWAVGEAAEAAGYTSRSHFASRFRERFGERPSAHRT